MRYPLLLIVAILSGGSLGAQRPAVFRATTEQVVAPVTVKDARGRLIGDLERADFRVLEDGVEQKITGFSADPAPLAAAVLIDAALSRPTAQRLRTTFSSLADAFSEFDEAGVFAFDTGFRTATTFTSERERIYEALRQMEIGAEYSQAGEPLSAPVPRINGWPVGGPPPAVRSGGAAAPRLKNIDDAVYAAARLLRARDPGRRKIILLISDGLNSSRNEVSAADLLTTLRKSGVGVYSIGLDDAKLSRNASVLARYGPPSGGDLFPVLKKTSL